MNFIASDPSVQLAFSLYESKGVFAVLIGSGLSRSAGIPTGWEITLDLVRRVALAQGVEDQSDWAAWCRDKTGEQPNYSELLEQLAASPEERRAILHGYIEPTEEDRQAGRKIPTKAHRAIAQLVRGGNIRVIVTTNFDRLMENALREQGIEPTIVTSVDALQGAEPITHSACYILKLHGDYKDARILNTDEELSSYPEDYDRLLDRIFDEHGLVVCGWSGEWDHALRAAFLRAPNRRYSTFWASRGNPGNGAQELIRHRDARLIPITEADSFFSTLVQYVETLEQSHHQNPQSIELLVGSAKRLLSKPEYRIQLDELLSQETERVLELLDHTEFAPHGVVNEQDFRIRVRKYEALTETLACMTGVLGRWGNDSDLPLVLDIIRSLYAQASKVRAGMTVYLNLRSYPATLVFTFYALGLVRAGRWATLHDLLNAKIDRDERQSERAVELLFLQTWDGTESDVWKLIEGRDRAKTPFSDHLLSLFDEWGKRFASLTPDFELLFERFEVLGSLAYLERDAKEVVELGLKGGQGGRDFVWMPVGRIGWHNSNRSKLVAEIQEESMKALLLAAGFAHADPQFFDLFIRNLETIAGRMRWM